MTRNEKRRRATNAGAMRGALPGTRAIKRPTVGRTR